MPDGDFALSPDRVSPLRRWAEEHVVAADGPMAGQRFTAGGGGQGRTTMPCWQEVLDAMDDEEVQQCTVRGSVQSGKTASLLVAALGHMAAGRSVLFYEPDDALKRAMARRLLAWGRACTDEEVREAYEPKRPPFMRQTASGGRVEVLSAREGGAGIFRTAEIIIVDELRVFHRDMLLDLVDRMASYGDAGRLITASSAGYENECRTSDRTGKIG